MQGEKDNLLHEEEIKTLIVEAVEAKEAEHASVLNQMQEQHAEQVSDCRALLEERDRCAAWPDEMCLPQTQQLVCPRVSGTQQFVRLRVPSVAGY